MSRTLFPPFLDKGSRDLGPNGPVRFLQNTLIAYMPEMAVAIGLVPDGDYRDKTQALVAAVQYEGMKAGDLESGDVDGNFGPRTRQYLAHKWGLDLREIPSQDGAECMYMAPEFSEPQPWNKKEEQPDLFSAAAAEAGAPAAPPPEEPPTA